MSIVVHHHPYTRAANVVWMLEELGLPYELRYVDLAAGEHKSPAYKALNPMGKLPTIVDGDVVVSETAAIGVYLADRYGAGALAPAVDDPARGAYLRWCFYGPSVVEPGSMAKAGGWEVKASAVGWGTWEEMLTTLEQGLTPGPWLLGERFSMADVLLGGTLRWMLQFGMMEKRPAFVAYVDRLNARPAAARATAKNQAIAAEHGLGR